MHEGGGRWVGSNKLIELKKKKDHETEHTPDTSCSRHKEGAQYMFASMTVVTLTLLTTSSMLPVHCSLSALTIAAAVGASLLSSFHSVLCSHEL